MSSTKAQPSNALHRLDIDCCWMQIFSSVQRPRAVYHDDCSLRQTFHIWSVTSLSFLTHYWLYRDQMKVHRTELDPIDPDHAGCISTLYIYSVVSRLAIIWLYSGGGDNDWSSPVENTNHVNVPVFWCSDETTLHTPSSLGSSPPLLPCLHWSLVPGQGPADAGDTVAVVACGQCDGSTLATVWSGAHWAARLVLSTVLCRVQPPPSSLSWGAAHILTLTQIIFQHCATPRTHTQQPPNRAATGTVGIRMEAWKWHGGQLTWLILTSLWYRWCSHVLYFRTKLASYQTWWTSWRKRQPLGQNQTGI